ncbi:hypothetical protein KQH42_30480, partial [Streptomyces sp. CHA1]|uniref:hypothetical protein n=1 Tax=Streptomyces sp. CHA1 TaxID=2841663 RepID=UPI00209468CE
TSLVGSEFEFDADSGKNIDLESEVDVSACDPVVVSDEEDSVTEDCRLELETSVSESEGSAKSEGYVHVADFDPADLYRGLRSAE